jgi:hypothetical protein
MAIATAATSSATERPRRTLASSERFTAAIATADEECQCGGVTAPVAKVRTRCV